MVPVSLVIDRPWLLPFPSTPALVSALAMAFFSTALAYLLFFRIMVRAGATNAALVTFVIPVSAIALGTLVLGEPLVLGHLLGFACILFSLIVLDGRVFQRTAP